MWVGDQSVNSERVLEKQAGIGALRDHLLDSITTVYYSCRQDSFCCHPLPMQFEMRSAFRYLATMPLVYILHP